MAAEGKDGRHFTFMRLDFYFRFSFRHKILFTFGLAYLQGPAHMVEAFMLFVFFLTDLFT